MFPRAKSNGKYEYLQIVENRRVNGKTRQQVIASLGRLDKLTESGQLDNLTRALGRFCKKVRVIDMHREGDIAGEIVRKIGPGLVFDRLWQALGIDKVLNALVCKRKFGFAVERAVFLTVLHRLFASGSDRKAEEWREDYVIEGLDGLDLHHVYRAMAWLGEELVETEQWAATPFSPRCTKDLIEEALFARRRDLFSTLDVVFFDTTSIYFKSEGGDKLGRRGKSKDHRPDLKQMIVGVVIDGEGRPVCCEMWPGNTIDEDKLKSEARYDGKWVLRTNTELSAEDVALKYKQLWMVEQIFRTTKSILETRPIWHKRDETIRGHVFCTFLALVLKTELYERLERNGRNYEWNDVRRDLEALQETELSIDDETYFLRTRLRGTCNDVLRSANVAIPRTLHQ